MAKKDEKKVAQEQVDGQQAQVAPKAEKPKVVKRRYPVRTIIGKRG